MNNVASDLELLIKKNMLAVRVSNALLLAQIMHIDITEPFGSEKVLRNLRLVEGRVGSDSR